MQEALPHWGADHGGAALNPGDGRIQPDATRVLWRPSKRVTRPGMALDSCSTTARRTSGPGIAGAAM